MFAQLEDREAEGVMRRHTAVVLERSADLDAIAAWERVRALSRAAGDASGELGALEAIARATRSVAPRSDAAVRAFEQALALAARLGEPRREAALRNTLGILKWESGAYAEALAHYEAALGCIRELGNRPQEEGLTLNSIGVTLSRLHRYEEARTALEDALGVNRRSGERLLEAHTLAALGDVACETGRFDAALAQFDASLAIRRQIDDRRGEGWMLHHLARTRGRTGDASGAEALFGEAERIADECGDAALRSACALRE